VLLSCLRLLGVFRFECSAPGTVSVPPTGQRILAYLGLHGHATRTVVAGMLWPDVSEDHAQGSLRTALWRLRRGRQPIVETHGEVLALADAVQVDVQAFTQTALLLVNSPGALGDELPLDLLSRGDLLLGWDEEWVLIERERLRQLRMHALESLSALLLGRGHHGLALEAALTCVGMAPLRESAHRAVAAVHLAENNVVEVYRHYAEFRRLSLDELGVEPSARFTAMLPPGRRR
jgi:DNA-binding SARP family transcriptional activator